MENIDHQPTSGLQDQPSAELDRALDAALAKYATAEPRAGLEERILANLRADREQVTAQTWWRWGLTAALAAVLVVMALVWKSGKPAHPVIANHPPTTAPAVEQPGPKYASKQGTNDNYGRAGTLATHRSMRRPRLAVVAENPKLDQFPSQRPLTEEELALAQYTREFPADAGLIAQAQTEYEIQIEEEMEQMGSDAVRPRER